MTTEFKLKVKEALALKENRIKFYTDFISSQENPELFINARKLDELGFFDAPCSTKYHCNYEGGLHEHSLYVAVALQQLTEQLVLSWERPESPLIVGFYHDLCKCDAYKCEGGFFSHNDQIVLPGHGDKSVIIAQKYLHLTDEEIACIRWHMGAFETDTKMWNYYGKAIEQYENVLWTHTADMYATRVFEK